MRQSFPKFTKLRRREEFLRISSKATKRYEGKWIAIDVCSNHSSTTRLGITVTRRYGKANLRNRFKRIVREAFRLCRTQLPQGLDLHIRPRSKAYQAKMQDISAEIGLMFTTE